MTRTSDQLSNRRRHTLPSGNGPDGVSDALSSLWLAVVVMTSVSLYRPLVIWAENAWDLAAPAELFIYCLAFLGIQVVVFLVLAAVGVKPTGAVVATAGAMLLLLHWETLVLMPAPAWLLLVAAAAIALHRWGSLRWLRTLAVMSAAVLALAPAIQTVTAHLLSTESYPIAELAPRRSANATGDVEDVLVVVVDSYPSLRLARSWFGHDPDQLISALSSKGLTVEENGWSHNTFTGLAIPSLLELTPIVDPGPKGAWRNRRSTFDLIRGDSLVATSLQSAGFEYTHVESGWDGAHCGSGPDVCLEAPWFNEVSWKLLESSVLWRGLLDRYGNVSVPGSLQTVIHLESLEEKFDDGNRDYVFAHMILPHAPIVVDGDCQVRSSGDEDTGILDPEEAEAESIQELAPQLACVDSLLARIAKLIGERTAVVITSDHGSNSGGQVVKPLETWTDADIAERLGILLAYKVPVGCQQGSTDSSIDAMRMVIGCAVDMPLPENNGIFLIGSEDPVAVDPARMGRIKAQVDQGLIEPNEG